MILLAFPPHPLKEALDFIQFTFGAIWSKSVEQPFDRIAIVFRIVAAILATSASVTKRQDVPWNRTWIVGSRVTHWNPMVGGNGVPKSPWFTTYRTTIIPVLQSAKPVVAGEIAWLFRFDRTPFHGVRFHMAGMSFYPIALMIGVSAFPVLPLSLNRCAMRFHIPFALFNLSSHIARIISENEPITHLTRQTHLLALIAPPLRVSGLLAFLAVALQTIRRKLTSVKRGCILNFKAACASLGWRRRNRIHQFVICRLVNLVVDIAARFANRAKFIRAIAVFVKPLFGCRKRTTALSAYFTRGICGMIKFGHSAYLAVSHASGCLQQRGGFQFFYFTTRAVFEGGSL